MPCTTAPHLHFGIYAVGGAIDPLPFVNKNRKLTPEVDAQLFKKSIRLVANTTLDVEGARKVLKAQTYAEPVALTATAYRVLFPDGTWGAVPVTAARDADVPLRTVSLQDTAFLLDKPEGMALQVRQLDPAAVVKWFGVYNGYALVQTAAGERGWVFEKVLN
jgi:murein DD-endopeptidase MepM/ murein hydrolase activator NlpD